jgi:hypothetical protein
MANGGIIGPVNDPQRGDVTTTFTASGTYTSPGFGPSQADYLVVAGGGGGSRTGGGGGAGGYRLINCVQYQQVLLQLQLVVVEVKEQVVKWK